MNELEIANDAVALVVEHGIHHSGQRHDKRKPLECLKHAAGGKVDAEHPETCQRGPRLRAQALLAVARAADLVDTLAGSEMSLNKLAIALAKLKKDHPSLKAEIEKL